MDRRKFLKGTGAAALAAALPAPPKQVTGVFTAEGQTDRYFPGVSEAPSLPVSPLRAEVQFSVFGAGEDIPLGSFIRVESGDDPVEQAYEIVEKFVRVDHNGIETDFTAVLVPISDDELPPIAPAVSADV